MIQTTMRASDVDVAEELVAAVAPLVARHRDEAEAARRLPPALVDGLRDAGAFHIATPRERGGLELPLRLAVETYEALGRLDGPVAWNIWNGNLGFAAAMLAEAAADRIWGPTPQPIIANSARVAGTGVAVAGGFVLSGRWDIVSAIDIADWVALFAAVPHEGAMDVRVLFVPVTEIEIVDTWHTSGMRGTGSNSVVAHEVVVPADLVISPFAPAWIDRPLYRIPAFTLASTGAAPIVVGVAQAALDELVHLATGKASDDGQVLARRPHVQTQVAEMQTALHAARLALLDAAAAIDGAAIAAAPVDELLRARLRAAMSHAAAVSRQVLQGCQLLASSSAVYTGTAIERLVRDGIVAAQHMILSPTHSQILGRLTFGFEAGTPVV